TVEEAATLMVDKSFHSLPVLDDGKLVGIVGKKDILKTLVGHGA
ncbi:MAG: CBS domain-containing protein, partial [Desulfobacterales bacterium]